MTDRAAHPGLAELSGPPHKTLAQWALTRLRDMIVQGQLAGGDRLYEHELAASMGISRTPVREAIRQLDREGLVTIHPNRDTVVTDFTAADVREIYQFRAAIEGMAVNLAATEGPLGASASASLFDILAGMEAALEAGEQEAYLDGDIAFHDAVVQASGNARLVEARLRVRAQTRRYTAFPLPRLSVESMRRNLAEHMRIAEAIRDGESEQAEKRMRAHVIFNGERIAHDMSEGAIT